MKTVKNLLLVLLAAVSLMSCSKEEQAGLSIIDNYILVKKELKEGNVITGIDICPSPWAFQPEGYLFINLYGGENGNCDLISEYYMSYTNTDTTLDICLTSGQCEYYNIEPYLEGGLKLTSLINDDGFETLYYLILTN
tara:strand:+ start:69 stop:482 length:414 start_codon:yes stop_codon:yes gene_type:complete